MPRLPLLTAGLLSMALALTTHAAPANDGDTAADPAAPTAPSNTNYRAGQSYYDSSQQQWIEYIAGDMPIVISVPHDGTLKPAVQQGCSVMNGRDTHTAPLAREIANALFTRYGKRPHLIINHLHRSKIDMNRGKPSFYDGCGQRETPEMDQAWTDWRQFITDALSASTTQFGNALYIDLHGHDHSNKRFEIGYYYPGAELRAFADNPNYSNKRYATLKNLPRLAQNETSMAELLYGETAFGSFLNDRHIAAVPSKNDPAPKEGEPFYNGGANTLAFTGKNFPQVFGWQIETHWKGIRDDEAAQRQSSVAIADSIIAFLHAHHPVFKGTSSWTVPPPRTTPEPRVSTESLEMGPQHSPSD